jgi:hypothetical protein
MHGLAHATLAASIRRRHAAIEPIDQPDTGNCRQRGGGEVGVVRGAGEVNEDVVEEGVQRKEDGQDDGDVAAAPRGNQRSRSARSPAR